MKKAVIISAPHSCENISSAFRNRIALSDFEIWQFSDPFTDKTSNFPKAFSIHLAKNHRILGDLNRDRNAKDIFRKKDFYNRNIWKSGKNLTIIEKKKLLNCFWDSFRNSILESFKKASLQKISEILFIDHHNTAIDHPANFEEYLPPIVLGNFGEINTGKKISKKKLSATPQIIQKLKKILQKNFPELTIELNKTYSGSSIVRFIRDEIMPKFPNIKINALILEYNLNFIFNPLSQRVDKIALKKITKGFNKSLEDYLNF